MKHQGPPSHWTPITQPTLELLLRFFAFKESRQPGGLFYIEDSRGEPFAFRSDCGSLYADPIFVAEIGDTDTNPMPPPKCGLQ